MKELSIKEKAKRYDKALEKARQLCAYPTSKPFISDLQDLFPELKESEDEKIKKWIRKELESKYVVDNIVNNVMADKALAWIEKQGEQKPTTPKFRVGDFIKLKDSDETYEVSKIEIFDTNEIYYHLTNGGCVCESADNFELVEQKPVVIPKFRVGDIIKATEDGEVFTIRTITKDKYIYTDDSFDWIKDQDEYELVEQKPTDEEMKELLHTEYEKGRADAIEEMQNPVWSEEDYNEIETIACHLDNIDNEGMAEVLRNIRDKYYSQSQWKPSDEHIKALNYVVNLMASSESPKENDYYYNVFKDLREQLKKLKE